MSLPSSLLEQIYYLVAQLPSHDVRHVAKAIASVPHGNWQSVKLKAQYSLAQPHARERISRLIDEWQRLGPDLAPASIAFALETASHCIVLERTTEQIDLVWTGPYSDTPPRRTDQTLLQLINSAQRELLRAILILNLQNIAESRYPYELVGSSEGYD